MATDPPLTPFTPAAAHARAVADLVNPLIAATLALHARVARCRQSGAAALGGSAPQLLAVLAEQLRASADLMRECVRAAGGTTRTRQTDAPAAATIPDTDAGASPRDGVRRLLADEDRFARQLRAAIAACDDGVDDRTADRLEEVLDEIERQRWFLSDLLRDPGAAARAPGVR